MSPVAGPLAAAALLVGVAGVAKVARPAAARVALRTLGLPSSALAVRALGVVEVALAAVALVAGGRLAGVLVAGAYLGFAAFAAALAARSRSGVSCGCFGSSSAPVSNLHVGIDLALAGVGLWAIVAPAPGLADVLADSPAAGVPFLGLVVLLTWLLVASLTALPELLAAVGDRAVPA